MQEYFNIHKLIHVIHPLTNWRIKTIWSSQQCIKSFWQNSTHLWQLSRNRIEGINPNIIKATYNKSTASLHLHTQWWKAESNPSNIRNKLRISNLTPFIQHSFGSPSYSNERRKRRGIQIRKEKVKLSLFADDILVYIEDPEDATRKLLELINEFGKAVGYKINTQKSVAVL